MAQTLKSAITTLCKPTLIIQPPAPGETDLLQLIRYRNNPGGLIDLADVNPSKIKIFLDDYGEEYADKIATWIKFCLPELLAPKSYMNICKLVLQINHPIDASPFYLIPHLRHIKLRLGPQIRFGAPKLFKDLELATSIQHFQLNICFIVTEEMALGALLEPKVACLTDMTRVGIRCSHPYTKPTSYSQLHTFHWPDTVTELDFNDHSQVLSADAWAPLRNLTRMETFKLDTSHPQYDQYVAFLLPQLPMSVTFLELSNRWSAIDGQLLDNALAGLTHLTALTSFSLFVDFCNVGLGWPKFVENAVCWPALRQLTLPQMWSPAMCHHLTQIPLTSPHFSKLGAIVGDTEVLTIISRLSHLSSLTLVPDSGWDEAAASSTFVLPNPLTMPSLTELRVLDAWNAHGPPRVLTLGPLEPLLKHLYPPNLTHFSIRRLNSSGIQQTEIDFLLEWLWPLTQLQLLSIRHGNFYTPALAPLSQLIMTSHTHLQILDVGSVQQGDLANMMAFLEVVKSSSLRQIRFKLRGEGPEVVVCDANEVGGNVELFGAQTSKRNQTRNRLLANLADFDPVSGLQFVLDRIPLALR